MELVTALFVTAAEGIGAALPEAGAAVAGAGTAAAAETAGAAGTAATAASSTWGALQGYMTAGSMLSQAGAGIASLMTGGINATQADLQAKEQALRIQSDYLKKVGSSRVAFAGSGVTLGSGSEAGVEDSLKTQEDFETSLAKATGKAKSTLDLISGGAGLLTSLGGISKTGANYAIDIAKRGSPS